MPRTTQKVKPTKESLEQLYKQLERSGYQKQIEWRSVDFRKETIYGYAIFSFVQKADETGFKCLTAHYILNTQNQLLKNRAFQFDKENKYPDSDYIKKALQFVELVDEELAEMLTKYNGLAAEISQRLMGEKNG
jgi:hypothetical protein